MSLQNLIDKLKSSNEMTAVVQKYSLLINEKSETQGALFFIPIDSKVYKVVIPAPFHLEVLPTEALPSCIKILIHKQALLLK